MTSSSPSFCNWTYVDLGKTVPSEINKVVLVRAWHTHDQKHLVEMAQAQYRQKHFESTNLAILKGKYYWVVQNEGPHGAVGYMVMNMHSDSIQNIADETIPEAKSEFFELIGLSWDVFMDKYGEDIRANKGIFELGINAGVNPQTMCVQSLNPPHFHISYTPFDGNNAPVHIEKISTKDDPAAHGYAIGITRESLILTDAFARRHLAVDTEPTAFVTRWNAQELEFPLLGMWDETNFTSNNPFLFWENQEFFLDINTQARNFLKHIKETSVLGPIMVGDSLETKPVWHHEGRIYDIDRVGYSFAIVQQWWEDGNTGWKLILKFFYSEKPKGPGYGCLEAGNYAILNRVPMPEGIRYENDDIASINALMQKRYYENPSTQSTRIHTQTRYQDVIR